MQKGILKKKHLVSSGVCLLVSFKFVAGRMEGLAFENPSAKADGNNIYKIEW